MDIILYVIAGVLLGFVIFLLYSVLRSDGDYRDKDILVIKQRGPGGRIVMQPKVVRLYEGGELKYQNTLDHEVKIGFTTTRDRKLGPFAEKAGETRGRFSVPAGSEDDRTLDVRGGGWFARSWTFEATVNGQTIDPGVRVKRG
jgi:hypothetical protein